jgi:hypothetical protein
MIILTLALLMVNLAFRYTSNPGVFHFGLDSKVIELVNSAERILKQPASPGTMSNVQLKGIASHSTAFPRTGTSVTKGKRSIHHSNSTNALPLALLKAREVLNRHPLNVLPSEELERKSLHEVMEYLSESTQCKLKPIFTSMASVGSDLYWQL